MRSILKKLIRSTGIQLVRARAGGSNAEKLDGIDDLSPDDREIVESVKECTMTSPARMASLLYSMKYLIENRIPGDIAECGVWRGGSMMIVAKALVAAGDTDRSLYLYDTYEGMPPPTDADTHDGKLAQDDPERSETWCLSEIDEVKKNVLSTGYPEDKIHFVKGKVEDTIPGTLPGPMALLRLDTDWYESTRHELEHLYPLLSEQGILIIDDYGYWDGARKAVDEFFATFKKPPFLHRIDRTGRLVVNPPRQGA